MEVPDQDIAARLKVLRHAQSRVQRIQQGLERIKQSDRLQADQSALDLVMTAAWPNVNVAAAGTVRAWPLKYGERGALKAFVLAAIQGAYAALRLAQFPSKSHLD